MSVKLMLTKSEGVVKVVACRRVIWDASWNHGLGNGRDGRNVDDSRPDHNGWMDRRGHQNLNMYLLHTYEAATSNDVWTGDLFAGFSQPVSAKQE